MDSLVPIVSLGISEPGCGIPKEYVCYEIREDVGPDFSAYASDQTTQTNFYTDTGCNDYYVTARNWFDCTLP